MCPCPTRSSSVDGRSRWASGAVDSRRLVAASSKRSPTPVSMLAERREHGTGEGSDARTARRGAGARPRGAGRKAFARVGERWLDVGSGAGSVAIRAARAGADVTALDSAEPLPEQARENAEAEALSIRFDHGNVEYLPYDDGEFDCVASAFGFIFSADHANVAGELARVVRRGGRLGFTAWKPNPKLGELYRRFTEEPLEGREATEW